MVKEIAIMILVYSLAMLLFEASGPVASSTTVTANLVALNASRAKSSATFKGGRVKMAGGKRGGLKLRK